MTLRKCITLNYIPHKNKSLSLFHVNTCSLNKTFDDPHPQFFYVVAISEAIITKYVPLSNKLNLIILLNLLKQRPLQLDFFAGRFQVDVFAIIMNHIYKCCNDLNINNKWFGIYVYWNCQFIKIYYCGSHLQTSICGP